MHTFPSFLPFQFMLLQFETLHSGRGVGQQRETGERQITMKLTRRVKGSCFMTLISFMAIPGRSDRSPMRATACQRFA